MNREDIIRMAREAGAIHIHQNPKEFAMVGNKTIERFAALVAAHVRETEFKPDWNNYRQGLADGADEEREACAQVCDGLWQDDGTAYDCREAIRARGQA